MKSGPRVDLDILDTELGVQKFSRSPALLRRGAPSFRLVEAQQRLSPLVQRTRTSGAASVSYPLTFVS